MCLLVPALAATATADAATLTMRGADVSSLQRSLDLGASGYNNKAKVLAFAKTVKAKGLKPLKAKPLGVFVVRPPPW